MTAEELAPVAHFGFADGTAFRGEGVRQRGSPQRTHRPRPRRSAWLDSARRRTTKLAPGFRDWLLPDGIPTAVFQLPSKATAAITPTPSPACRAWLRSRKW